MQNGLSDEDIVRLIAYVKPIQISDDGDIEDIEEEDLEIQDDTQNPDEYLIDFMTVGEAKSIGSNGILSKVAETLMTKNVINKNENSSITWRLVPTGGLTPIEFQTKLQNEELGFEQEKYQVVDLRHLH